LLILKTQGVALGCIVIALSGRQDRLANGMRLIVRRRQVLEGHLRGDGGEDNVMRVDRCFPSS